MNMRKFLGRSFARSPAQPPAQPPTAPALSCLARRYSQAAPAAVPSGRDTRRGTPRGRDFLVAERDEVTALLKRIKARLQADTDPLTFDLPFDECRLPHLLGLQTIVVGQEMRRLRAELAKCGGGSHGERERRLEAALARCKAWLLVALRQLSRPLDARRQRPEHPMLGPAAREASARLVREASHAAEPLLTWQHTAATSAACAHAAMMGFGKIPVVLWEASQVSWAYICARHAMLLESVSVSRARRVYFERVEQERGGGDAGRRAAEARWDRESRARTKSGLAGPRRPRDEPPTDRPPVTAPTHTHALRRAVEARDSFGRPFAPDVFPPSVLSSYVVSCAFHLLAAARRENPRLCDKSRMWAAMLLVPELARDMKFADLASVAAALGSRYGGRHKVGPVAAAPIDTRLPASLATRRDARWWGVMRGEPAELAAAAAVARVARGRLAGAELAALERPTEPSHRKACVTFCSSLSSFLRGRGYERGLSVREVLARAGLPEPHEPRAAPPAQPHEITVRRIASESERRAQEHSELREIDECVGAILRHLHTATCLENRFESSNLDEFRSMLQLLTPMELGSVASVVVERSRTGDEV